MKKNKWNKRVRLAVICLAAWKRDGIEKVWHPWCNGSGGIFDAGNISTELQHPILRNLIGAKLCPLATCGGLR